MKLRRSAWTAQWACLWVLLLTPSGLGGQETDGWTGHGPEGGFIEAIAIDPADSKTVYVATQGGVFKSIDAGASWNAVNTGLLFGSGIYSYTYALAIDPVTSSTVYAGGAGGVFKSVDRGVNWSPTIPGLTPPSVNALAIDPTNGNIIYAGTQSGGVIKSANGGTTWGAVNSGLSSTFVQALAIDPTTPTTLFASTGGGVFKTTNGGTSWSAVNNGLNSSMAPSALAIDPTTPATLYAAAFSGIFKTTNGGLNWSAVNTGLIINPLVTNPDARAIVIDPASPATLYAMTSEGAFKSINGGANWNPINTGLTATLNVQALAIDPATPATIYAGSLAGIFKTTNGGTNWSSANSGLTATIVNAVAVDSSTPAVVYAGTSAGGVFKSANAGASWSAAGLLNTYVYALAVDPATPTTIYAGGTGQVSKSLDAGGSWTAANAGLPTCGCTVQSLAIDPTNPNTLYAGLNNPFPSGGDLFKSVNGGVSWTPAHTGLTASVSSVEALIIDPSAPTTLYAAASGGGIFKSTNGGASWTAINTGLDTTFVDALAIDSAAPATLYAVTGRPFVVFKSTNAGDSWVRLSAPISDLNTVAVDPATSDVYVGGYGGVFKSSNGGGTWTAIGLSHSVVQRLSLDSGGGTTKLYAGSYGGGVFTMQGNTAPSISDVVNQSILAGNSTGPLAFAISDAETNAASLTVSASSSNQTLIPNSNIAIGGSGGNRTVTVTGVAGQTGTATITLTVSDGALTASDTFVVTVTAVANTAPTISTVADQTITQGTSTGALALTVGDAETAAAGLTLSGTSTNQTLVPNSNIVFGGSGNTRTVTVTPIAGQVGSTTITVVVSDGSLTASSGFSLTVVSTPVLRAPVNLAVVSVTGNSVTLGWSVPTNSITPTGYVVEGGLTPASVLGSLPTGGTATSFTFSAPTGAFYVRVHSLAGSARSAASNEIRIFVNVPTPPGAPTNLGGTATGSSLALTWRNATTGGTPTFVQLGVTGAITLTMSLPVSESFSFAGVPPGTYTFAVRAGNSTETSAPSNSVTLTFPGGCPTPGAPINLSATRSGNQVTVSWAPPLSGAAATGYLVMVGGAFTATFPTTGLSLSGTAGAGTYAITVVATSACGNGAPASTQITVP